MTEADIAFFGQKDFQQVMVVKQMVEDLNVPDGDTNVPDHS